MSDVTAWLQALGDVCREARVARWGSLRATEVHVPGLSRKVMSKIEDGESCPKLGQVFVYLAALGLNPATAFRRARERMGAPTQAELEVAGQLVLGS